MLLGVLRLNYDPDLARVALSAEGEGGDRTRKGKREVGKQGTEAVRGNMCYAQNSISFLYQ